MSAMESVDAEQEECLQWPTSLPPYFEDGDVVEDCGVIRLDKIPPKRFHELQDLITSMKNVRRTDAEGCWGLDVYYFSDGPRKGRCYVCFATQADAAAALAIYAQTLYVGNPMRFPVRARASSWRSVAKTLKLYRYEEMPPTPTPPPPEKPWLWMSRASERAKLQPEHWRTRTYLLRGLPFEATEDDVKEFLKPVEDFCDSHVLCTFQEDGATLCSGNLFVTLRDPRNGYAVLDFNKRFFRAAALEDKPPHERTRPRFVDVLPSTAEQMLLTREKDRRTTRAREKKQSHRKGNAAALLAAARTAAAAVSAVSRPASRAAGSSVPSAFTAVSASTGATLRQAGAPAGRVPAPAHGSRLRAPVQGRAVPSYTPPPHQQHQHRGPQQLLPPPSQNQWHVQQQQLPLRLSHPQQQPSFYFPQQQQQQQQQATLTLHVNAPSNPPMVYQSVPTALDYYQHPHQQQQQQHVQQQMVPLHQPAHAQTQQFIVVAVPSGNFPPPSMGAVGLSGLPQPLQLAHGANLAVLAAADTPPIFVQASHPSMQQLYNVPQQPQLQQHSAPMQQAFFAQPPTMGVYTLQQVHPSMQPQ